MVFQWEKNILISWKKTLKKWTFTTLGPILRFALKLVPGIHEPLISLLPFWTKNHEMQGLSITFSNKLHFPPSLQFAMLLLHAIIKELAILMDLVNVMLNSQELIATLQVNRYLDMIISTTLYWYLHSRCLMVSTNQADPSCFYFWISRILMERHWT